MIRVDGCEYAWSEGMSVLELVGRLPDSTYEVVVVKLNDKLVNKPQFAGTLVPDGSEVRTVPLIAGG